ncbi:MarR family transcriptional regulator [Kribbella antibiotica]|uniref:MarR family transcriptional regulator n=1 Tax=Kribbella antibiotica TaxID=190195 RepID=A0A4R4ZJL1_9ACTN|nr:MarR family transcriptional regulator [Kribbella antibiotica]TDD57964.1 MarR family transcriptional regulator [Kribbella antibiotica]
MNASDNTAEQIAARLDAVIRRQRRAARADVEGLTHGRFRVLRTLDQAGRPLRLSELATQLGIVPRSATSVVDDLEAGGLLNRLADD